MQQLPWRDFAGMRMCNADAANCESKGLSLNSSCVRSFLTATIRVKGKVCLSELTRNIFFILCTRFHTYHADTNINHNIEISMLKLMKIYLKLCVSPIFCFSWNKEAEIRIKRNVTKETLIRNIQINEISFITSNRYNAYHWLRIRRGLLQHIVSQHEIYRDSADEHSVLQCPEKKFAFAYSHNKIVFTNPFRIRLSRIAWNAS